MTGDDLSEMTQARGILQKNFPAMANIASMGDNEKRQLYGQVLDFVREHGPELPGALGLAARSSHDIEIVRSASLTLAALGNSVTSMDLAISSLSGPSAKRREL